MADNDDIPFNRDFPLRAGVVDEVRPGVRRVLCNNPSPFTFTGTVTNSSVMTGTVSGATLPATQLVLSRELTPESSYASISYLR